MANVWQEKKVLIVDDSEVLREHLKTLYTSLGMQVIGMASNGVEAVRFCETKIPDLVSLDIVMPEMNGIECYRVLSRSYESLKFLFVTVLSGESSLIERFNPDIPASLFISKPVKTEILKDRLNEIFEPAKQLSSKIAS